MIEVVIDSRGRRSLCYPKAFKSLLYVACEDNILKGDLTLTAEPLFIPLTERNPNTRLGGFLEEAPLAVSVGED